MLLDVLATLPAPVDVLHQGVDFQFLFPDGEYMFQVDVCVTDSSSNAFTV